MTDTTSAPRRGVPVWAQVIIWLGLLGLLAIMAFGLKRTQQGSVVVGDELPDFTVTFFEGYAYENRTEIKLSELKGKVVVLNFWASWCLACRDEHADLSASARAYAGKPVQFLGVLYNDVPGAGTDWIRQMGGQAYPSVLDPGARTAIDYGLYGVPETFIIDGTGRVAYKHTGPVTTRILAAKIDSLLAAPAPGPPAPGPR
jgi:cytochrome c biogenesis protein CcmG/thiol:disulfide interchange protein DsbE